MSDSEVPRRGLLQGLVAALLPTPTAPEEKSPVTKKQRSSTPPPREASGGLGAGGLSRVKNPLAGWTAALEEGETS